MYVCTCYFDLNIILKTNQGAAHLAFKLEVLDICLSEKNEGVERTTIVFLRLPCMRADATVISIDCKFIVLSRHQIILKSQNL